MPGAKIARAGVPLGHAGGRFAPQVADVPLHLQAGEPFDVARQVSLGADAAGSIDGRELRPLLGDRLARGLLALQASAHALLRWLGTGNPGRGRTGLADVDGWDHGERRAHRLRVLARLVLERGEAGARLRDVRAGGEFLDIAVERGGGAGARRVGPGLVVRLLARPFLRWRRRLTRRRWLLRCRSRAAERQQPGARNEGGSDDVMEGERASHGHTESWHIVY